MRDQIQLKRFFAALGLMLLSSCGGGGFAGIDGSGQKPDNQHVSASGPINGFGSVIVNGVHYDTDNAKIYVRGQLADEVELDVGDYVVVVGEFKDGEGIAKEVHYQPRVTGVIESVDVNFNRLVVMGQTIQLVEDTTYSSDITPRNIEGFEVGQKVTVSGISDAQEVVRASRIEKTQYDAYEVLGAIEKLDTVGKTFFLDKLKVDYGSVAFLAGELIEGKVVAVAGREVQDGVLLANTINFNMDISQLKDLDSIEFTGFVKYLSANKFFIDAIPVTFDASTTIEGGSVADLSNNDKVRIKGTLVDGAGIKATLVEILPTPDMQVYGTLQSIVPASWGSPYIGTIQVQDHVFRVKFDTRLDGDQEQRINFFDLLVGDSVYVSGYAEDGTLYASSVSVDNRKFEHFTYLIQGFAYAVVPEQNSFSIFNTRVMTNEETVFGDGATSYTEEEFYSLLTSQYVQVIGYFDFTTYHMVATRVTFPFIWSPPPPPPTVQ